MSKIAVTGATGFLGRHVILRLLRNRTPVIAILSNPLSFRSLTDFLKIQLPHQLPENTWFDLSGEEENSNFAKELAGCETLVHLAALIPKNRTIPTDQYLEVNVAGTLRLFEQAKKAGVKKIIFASTWQVYGNSVNGALSENAPLNPEHDYGKSKLFAEKAVRDFSRSSGLPVTILRFSNLYGPDPSQEGIIYKIIKSLSEGKAPHIHGDGTQKRDYLNISDAVSGVLCAINSNKPGIFNIGSGTPCSMNELAETCAEIYSRFGRASKKPVYEKTGPQFSRWTDISKAKSELGFSPSVSLHAGLSEVINWYEKRAWEETGPAEKKKKLASLKLILFDWDGTLVEIKKRYTASFLLAINQLGLELSDLSKYGQDFDDSFKRSFPVEHINWGKDPLEDVVWKLRRNGKSGTDIFQMIARFPEYSVLAQAEILRKKFVNDQLLMDKSDELISGVRETLAKLSESGLKLGLVTRREPATLSHQLEKWNLKKYFSYVISVPKGEEKGESFSKLLSELNLMGVDAAIVGDTDEDIYEGKKHNLITIGVCTGLSSLHKLAEEYDADLIVENVSGVQKIFG